MSGIGRHIARRLPTRLKRAVKRAVFFGGRRYCPVCGSSTRQFQTGGTEPRRDARCPFCNSLERHRLVWRYLQDKTNFFRMSGAKMLHVAPEPCFERQFRAVVGADYLTADLMQPADVKMDLTDIQFPDKSFDIVYCSHVLEHVPDDRQAMRELCRVLKPDGWAILMVPITVDRTFEDPSITDPAERLRLFGQDDHVRRYGPDFVDRLNDSGFGVTVVAASDFLSAAEIARLAVGNAFSGEVFHCTANRA